MPAGPVGHQGRLADRGRRRICPRSPPEAPPSTLPDISSELLPWVMRGAADSDYPDSEAVSALAQPVLILAGAGDPGHPESTARRLHELLPQSELHIASHLPEMRAWGERIDAFLN